MELEPELETETEPEQQLTPAPVPATEPQLCWEPEAEPAAPRPPLGAIHSRYNGHGTPSGAALTALVVSGAALTAANGAYRLSGTVFGRPQVPLQTLRSG